MQEIIWKNGGFWRKKNKIGGNWNTEEQEIQKTNDREINRTNNYEKIDCFEKMW